SDQAGGIVGSLGMLASASIGGSVGLYEPVHGSAPDIAGQGIANPLGAILSVAMLLRHSFKLEREAACIETAVAEVLAAGNRTRDLAKPSQGKLFRIETEAGSHQDPAADSGARKPVRRLEYFWLCDDCASQMTLARKNGEIVTVPREQMRAAATGS